LENHQLAIAAVSAPMTPRRRVVVVAACAALAACAAPLAVVAAGPAARRRLDEMAAAVLDGVTGHKTFLPTDFRDAAGFVAAALGLMIAAGGGIGGGGMLVPIYVLVLGFKPKFAIPLSNMTVLGGAITNVSMNAQKRHPLADRSLVDWDLLILMEPLTLAGALVGGFVNKLAPELVITVLLVILLYLTSERTLKKGFKLYAKETAQFSAAMELTAEIAAEEAAAEAEGLLDDDDDERSKAAYDAAGPPEEHAAALAAIHAEEALAFPPWKVGVLLGMFTLTVAMNLAKGCVVTKLHGAFKVERGCS